MNKSYPFSVLLFLGFLVAAILMAGGRIAFFVSLPAFSIVVAITFVLLLGSFSFREIGHSFAAIYGDHQSDTESLESACGFFETMERYLIVSGILGFFVGVVTLLANLQDASAIGSGTALALLTVIYGLVLDIGLAVPFKAAARKKLAALSV